MEAGTAETASGFGSRQPDLRLDRRHALLSLVANQHRIGKDARRRQTRERVESGLVLEITV